MVARAGSYSEPLAVEVAAQPVKKKRGWVWGVVVGVAVAAVGVGLGVGLTVGRSSSADLQIIAPQR